MIATQVAWNGTGLPEAAPDDHRRHVCVVTETYPPEINGVALTLARLCRGAARARPRRLGRAPAQACDATAQPARSSLRCSCAASRCPATRPCGSGCPAGARLRARWRRGSARRGVRGDGRPAGMVGGQRGPRVCSACRCCSGFHTNFHGYARHYRAGWLAARRVARYLRRFHNRTDGTLVRDRRAARQLDARGFQRLTCSGAASTTGLFTPARRCPALRARVGRADRTSSSSTSGRLAPEKNVDLAIEAYRAMRRRGAGCASSSSGTGPLRAALQQAHPDLLLLLALLTGEPLAAHYASADVFLFPSETETFGNVTSWRRMASGLAAGRRTTTRRPARTSAHGAPARPGALAAMPRLRRRRGGRSRARRSAARACGGAPASRWPSSTGPRGGAVRDVAGRDGMPPPLPVRRGPARGIAHDVD